MNTKSALQLSDFRKKTIKFRFEVKPSSLETLPFKAEFLFFRQTNRSLYILFTNKVGLFFQYVGSFLVLPRAWVRRNKPGSVLFIAGFCQVTSGETAALSKWCRPISSVKYRFVYILFDL